MSIDVEDRYLRSRSGLKAQSISLREALGKLGRPTKAKLVPTPDLRLLVFSDGECGNLLVGVMRLPLGENSLLIHLLDPFCPANLLAIHSSERWGCEPSNHHQRLSPLQGCSPLPQ